MSDFQLERIIAASSTNASASGASSHLTATGNHGHGASSGDADAQPKRSASDQVTVTAAVTVPPKHHDTHFAANTSTNSNKPMKSKLDFRFVSDEEDDVEELVTFVNGAVATSEGPNSVANFRVSDTYLTHEQVGRLDAGRQRLIYV